MQNEQTISGTLRLEEYQQYATYTVQKQTRTATLAIAVLLFLLLSLATTFSWITNLIYSIIVLVLLPQLTKRSIKKQTKEEYESDQTIRSEITYVVGEEGLHSQKKNSDTLYLWDEFLIIHEHPNLFRLHVSKKRAVIIPKRYFQTEAQFEQFRTILTKKLPPHKIIQHKK